MDHQHQHHQSSGGPSPPTGAQQQQQQQQHDSNISQGQSPAPAPASYNTIGLGLIDPSNLSFNSYPSQDLGDTSNSFGLGTGVGQQQLQDPSYPDQSQGEYTQSLLSTNFQNPDFTLFPSATEGQFNTSTPLFAGDNLQQFGGAQENTMAATQASPSQHLTPEPQQPGSAQHSPSFGQHHFSPPRAGRHSRNVSLTPQDAYYLGPGQMGVDWTQTMGMQGRQFREHRRSPSDFSDVSSAAISSVAPSPNLVSVEAFADQLRQQGHPESELLNELQRIIPNISISDQGTHSPNPTHPNGRTPAHSPAISPRIMPQQMPDMNPQQHMLVLQSQSNSFGPPASYGSMQVPEQFPTLQQSSPDAQMNQFQIQAPPQIQVDYAPNAVPNGPGPGKTLDADSLTPPDRGRPKQRQRAISDPFNSSAMQLGHRRTPSGSNLSPHDGSSPSRALSPAGPSGSGAASLSPSPNRRRHSSTSSVPSNAVALRLVDAETHGENGAGGSKRVQKHQANFQCTLCPKRFTRAYNLRSHLRTHTDERPFICTVCSKAFARQHDRKRHEGLHSGEKKFPCKGPLKSGGQWGCGRKFARADALGRHFRSEAGRICIKPLLDEEAQELGRSWHEQQMQQAAQNMNMGMGMQQPMMGMAGGGMMMSQTGMAGMDPNGPGGYPQPLNPSDQFVLPAAIYAQFPQLRNMQWPENDMGGGSGMEDDMKDELSGQSNFDPSDYEELDDGGYVSGPGTGFGPGGGNAGYVDNGYSSDFGR